MNKKRPLSKMELLDKLANNLRTIREFGVTRIGLFGSAVMGGR